MKKKKKKKTCSIDLISFLRQSWSIGYPEINRGRIEWRDGEREKEREGRRISSSTGSINHQGESENPDSWGLDGLGEKEEKKQEECERRS